nr:hypothetical protein [Aeromonas veronii]
MATRLTLSQRLEPATTGEVGEPLIRILTLTMENGDSGQIQLAPLMAHQLPSGIQAHPDGEQQQERYRDGKLLFERQWRQTLVAEQSGDYQLPPIDLPWFNTQSGRIEQASLPAITLTFQTTTNRQPDQQTSQVALRESLWWVVLALALRALWRYGPPLARLLSTATRPCPTPAGCQPQGTDPMGDLALAGLLLSIRPVARRWA